MDAPRVRVAIIAAMRRRWSISSQVYMPAQMYDGLWLRGTACGPWSESANLEECQQSGRDTAVHRQRWNHPSPSPGCLDDRSNCQADACCGSTEDPAEDHRQL